MEIQWRHVFLLIALIYLLIHVGPIINTLGEIIAGGLGALNSAFDPLRSYRYNAGSSTYDLARLCVLLIFIIGVLKLFKGNRR